MTTTTTYTADARFEDGQWQASVRALPGAHTYARTLETLRKRLREVIVLMADRGDAELNDTDAFDVALAIQVHVTDSIGVSDSVSVTVVPPTVAARAEVGTPPGGATAAIELNAGASLGAPAAGAKGAIELNAGASLSGAGSLSASAAAMPPHEAVAYAADLRRQLEEKEHEVEHATRIAVLVALAGGIGMRDIALILGISYQRVSQIAAEGETAVGTVQRRRARRGTAVVHGGAVRGE